VLRSSLLALLALAACGGSSASPDAQSTSLGGARPVKLQVPPDVAAGQRYPLVLILHGYGANGFVQQGIFWLRDLPTTHHAFVLAPDGTIDSTGKQFWNADPACCDIDHTGVDDVAYLGGLIDTVMATRPIDPARVFVVGHSNGAFMAYRLACDRADVVTAIVGLAGAAASTPSACAPKHPVSILDIHGNADDTVPYDGAVKGDIHQPGALATIAQWAGYNGCTGALTNGGRLDLDSILTGDETQTAATGGCPAGGAADRWTIDGGSHLPDFQPTLQSDLWTWLDGHARP
jgi:polyhydroxybutyrate depolymerase